MTTSNNNSDSKNMNTNKNNINNCNIIKNCSLLKQQNNQSQNNNYSSNETISSNFNYDSAVQDPLGQFGRGSISILVIIQMGMVTVTGITLSPTYHKIVPNWTCDLTRNGTNFTEKLNTAMEESGTNYSLDNHCDCSTDSRVYSNRDGFHSFSRTFELYCEHSYKGFHIATYLAAGGLLGVVCFGQLADSFGRKYIGFMTLAGILLFSFTFMFTKSYTVGCLIMVVIGFFGGGYMGVGIVTAIEFVGREYRLVASCFHGWPYGMMYMSLVGFITKNWRYYHLAMSLTGVPFLIGWLFIPESPRWLIQMNKLEQAKSTLDKIAKFNGGNSTSPSMVTLKRLYEAESVNRGENTKFTYFDLFYYPSVLKQIASLAFVWFASGLISYGIYVNLGSLSGIIYLNVFLTGLFKALAGSILPLVLNIFFGRRPIILLGILASSVFMWGITGIYIYQGHKGGALGVLITILAMLSVTAMDPTWKMNQLYSSELFPTLVRNMSNGICNMGSRIASIIAPLISSLVIIYLPAPYIIFSTLGVLQFLMALFFLPETKGKPMPDSLPPRKAIKPSKYRADNSDAEGLPMETVKIP